MIIKGKLHRMIRSNFVESLKRNKINTTPAFVRIKDLQMTWKRKFAMIRDELSQKKFAFSDTKVVFLNRLDNCFLI